MSKLDYDKKKFSMDSYGNLYPKEKCKKHPKYKVILKPRCDCEVCWRLWNQKKLDDTTNVKMPKNA